CHTHLRPAYRGSNRSWLGYGLCVESLAYPALSLSDALVSCPQCPVSIGCNQELPRLNSTSFVFGTYCCIVYYASLYFLFYRLFSSFRHNNCLTTLSRH